jgi:hypothetical protein
VLGGVGLHLRAVNGHPPQLDQTRSLAESEDLQEQLPELLHVPPAKVRDRIVVRVLVGGQNPEGHVRPSGLLDLA